MKSKIRWFKIVDPDEPIPGLWKSLNCTNADVEYSLDAFRKAGFAVTEIDKAEVRRIRRQQNAADRKATREE